MCTLFVFFLSFQSFVSMFRCKIVSRTSKSNKLWRIKICNFAMLVRRNKKRKCTARQSAAKGAKVDMYYERKRSIAGSKRDTTLRRRNVHRWIIFEGRSGLVGSRSSWTQIAKGVGKGNPNKEWKQREGERRGEIVARMSNSLVNTLRFKENGFFRNAKRNRKVNIFWLISHTS